MQQTNAKGFSLVMVIAAIAGAAVLAFGGWFVWQKNQDTKIGQPKDETKTLTKVSPKIDDTKDWTHVTTQGGAFSMKVPDGWRLIRYPGDYIGGFEVAYKQGIPASIETSMTEYMGHSLRFRASITAFDDAGLGPQWSSPQVGLEETTEDFSIGSLKGKKYKGNFSQSLQQTLYEYVFDVGNNKKLGIVYTVYHDKEEKDEKVTVEKAIKTIQFNGLP